MHIPDGFLDTKTVIGTSTLSLLALSRAFRNITKQLPPRTIPLMGLAAAFIFVAQMLNFPVAGGTSGHLIGAVLVSVLLGPSAGILVMTVVLVVQCFIFADGGVFALGANIFNMAIVGSVGGYYIYRMIHRIIPNGYGKLMAVAFASWVSTVIASICCTGELAWSGTVHWSMGFPAMTGIHMLIGAGEGMITMLIIAAIYKTRPDLLSSPITSEKTSTKPITDMLVYGAVVIFGLVLFVSPFASSWPDGLERVASTFGFESKALAQPVLSSPIADYHVPGIGSLSLATVLAGLIGAVIVFLLSFVLARLLLRKPKNIS